MTLFDSDYSRIAKSEKTISIEMIETVVKRAAMNLSHSVRTFKIHPSYDTRKNLAARSNELAGMFHLLLKLNGYREVDSEVREQVSTARELVASLYKQPGRK